MTNYRKLIVIVIGALVIYWLLIWIQGAVSAVQGSDAQVQSSSIYLQGSDTQLQPAAGGLQNPDVCLQNC